MSLLPRISVDICLGGGGDMKRGEEKMVKMLKIEKNEQGTIRREILD
jgi:hypothetical protein